MVYEVGTADRLESRARFRLDWIAREGFGVRWVSVAVLPCLALAGCAGASSVRTSANTALVQASAAPACGGQGAAKVAEKQAAIETIRAGYDRYVIVDAASANNVTARQLPGTYQTNASVYGNMVTAQTTYTPGPVIVSGSHDQAFAIRMFRDGDPGAEYAIPARDVLGKEWERIVRDGVMTCL